MGYAQVMQSSINQEGCSRKGIQRKNGGDDGGGSLISSEGVAPSWTVGVSISVIFPCTIKNPEDNWLEKVRSKGRKTPKLVVVMFLLNVLMFNGSASS